MATKMLASRRLHSKISYKIAAASTRDYSREISRIDPAKAAAVMDTGNLRTKCRAEQLLAVALYVKLVEAGKWAPLIELSETLGVNRKRATNIIQFARQNGYLASPGNGSRGGAVSAKAFSDAQALGLLP